MRILFLTENFPPETNAAATRVYERACYWVKWGHDVTVVTCAPNFPYGRLFDGYKNSWRQIELMDGIRVVRVKTYISPNQGIVKRTLDFMSFMFSSVIVSLFEKRPDVVVSTSPQFFAAISGWLLGGLRRVPFIFELGDLWPASIVAVGAMRDGVLIRFLERLELFLYRKASAVISLTHAFKANLVSRGISRGKIAVVLNGVDLWRYGPCEPDPYLKEVFSGGGRFVVGYVGTHGMAHGLNNVLKAAELLREREDITFLFVGAGSERAGLIANAEGCGLANVTFMPPQPKAMVPAVWSQCQIALVHLRNLRAFKDVIPSKMFEAMGMGLPIILSIPEGEASAILKKRGAGVHIPPDDPVALANVITQLADDKEWCQSLASNSVQAAPRHSRETQAAHMLSVLEAVKAGGGGCVDQISARDIN